MKKNNGKKKILPIKPKPRRNNNNKIKAKNIANTIAHERKSVE
jgi:hypothetical protein